jgi:transposase-like protein
VKTLLLCSARSKSTRATSGALARASADEVPQVRFLCLACLKRGVKVYARVIPDAKGKTLKAIIDTKVVPDSIVYSDTLSSYNVLDVSSFKHFRINHSKLFSNQKNHINGIENFWNQAKRHMRRFNGVPKDHFHLFLKECEWRFNTPKPKQPQPNNLPEQDRTSNVRKILDTTEAVSGHQKACFSGHLPGGPW